MSDEAVATPEERLRAGGYEAVVAAAEVVGAEFASHADEHDRASTYAFENVERLWIEGLGNLTVPTADGGVGADLRTTAAAVRALAMGDPSTALILVMHLVHILQVVAKESPWPDHLRRRILTESLERPALINALRVEPELGTPARGGIPATRATRVVDAYGEPAWSLSGHKIYSTGSVGLRFMIVWGATEDADVDGLRTGAFLVTSNLPGIEIRETWDHLGMRGSASNDVIFHDVIVPLDHAIGLRAPGEARASGGELQAWMTVLTVSIYDGVARAARDWLVGYLNERIPTNLGAPLASLERFQAAVGEIESLLYANEQILGSLSAAVDSGGDEALRAAERAPLAKVLVTKNVIEVVEIALRLIGNPGLSYHNPLQRHYRDALCSRIHTPQDDVVLGNFGRLALAR